MPAEDVEELMIAGCRVRLAFRPAEWERWTVRGTVQCGIGENRGGQSVTTDACDSREAAEQQAISRVSTLFGQHVDRSHSRKKEAS